jgi:predicted ribosomally synthesized peptide with SipW-like signal peptide
MKRLLIAVLGIGLISTLGAIGGLTAFTDQETTTGNAFDSGDVDLLLGTTTALVTYTNMKPGDTTGPQSLLVTNNGSLDLTYTMSTTMVTDTGTPLLGDALDLTIWEDVSQNGCTAPGTGDDGAALYGAADLNNGALGARALTSGSNETLCFRVDFPSAATGPESASADASFVFDATQS